MDNNRLISLLSECCARLFFFFFWHNIADVFAASVTNLQVAGGLVCGVAVGHSSGALGSGQLKPAGCNHCLCFGPGLFLPILPPAMRPRGLATGWEVGSLCCGFRSTLNSLNPVYSPLQLSVYSFVLLTNSSFFFFNWGKNTCHENYPIKFLSIQYNVNNDRHRVAHQILEIYSSRIMKILYQSNSNFPSHWQPLFHFFFLPFLLLWV